MIGKSVSILEDRHVEGCPSADVTDLPLQDTTRLVRPDIFVGRQPVYDRQLGVFAYEILFPGHECPQDKEVKPFQATSQLIVNALLDIGLEAIAGSKRALISLTGGSLLLDYALTLPADQTIVSITSNTHLDTILLERVRELSTHGYLLAIDGLAAQHHLDKLAHIAGIITIDTSTLDAPRLARQVAALRGARAALLATHVDTPEALETCQQLGFTYFQGSFLCQPDVLKGRRSATNRLALLQLLARLQDPDIEFSEVDELVSRDVSLSYKLLQVVNSAFFGLSRKIESIRQAILLLGLKSVMTWVSLIMLTGIDDKPYELLTTAMVRARMCDRLAQALGHDKAETFFLVGLFSVLDALMDTPMPEVLASLPLADEVTQAILCQEGLLGAALGCVLAYEQGKWDDVTCPGLDSGMILDAYVDATAWASQMNKTLSRA